MNHNASLALRIALALFLAAGLVSGLVIPHWLFAAMSAGGANNPLPLPMRQPSPAPGALVPPQGAAQAVKCPPGTRVFSISGGAPGAVLVVSVDGATSTTTLDANGQSSLTVPLTGTVNISGPGTFNVTVVCFGSAGGGHGSYTGAGSDTGAKKPPLQLGTERQPVPEFGYRRTGSARPDLQPGSQPPQTEIARAGG